MAIQASTKKSNYLITLKYPKDWSRFPNFFWQCMLFHIFVFSFEVHALHVSLPPVQIYWWGNILLRVSAIFWQSVVNAVPSHRCLWFNTPFLTCPLHARSADHTEKHDNTPLSLQYSLLLCPFKNEQGIVQKHLNK